jgi:hypothetical protein
MEGVINNLAFTIWVFTHAMVLRQQFLRGCPFFSLIKRVKCSPKYFKRKKGKNVTMSIAHLLRFFMVEHACSLFGRSHG